MWGSRLLVRTPASVTTRTKSGLWLPPQAAERQRYRRWEIVAVGDDVGDKRLRPGVQVLISQQFAGEPFDLDNMPHRVILEEHAIALVVGEPSTHTPEET